MSPSRIQRRFSSLPNPEFVIPADLPADLRPLWVELRQVGVDIRLQTPPKAGAYGLYQSRPRLLWVSPITRDLGIFRTTFLHEAVHAVQACKVNTPLPLGIKTKLTPVIQRRVQQLLYSGYSPEDAALEQEAFEIQGRSDAVPLLISLLRSRCR